jgi:hypothetical protein
MCLLVRTREITREISFSSRSEGDGLGSWVPMGLAWEVGIPA